MKETISATINNQMPTVLISGTAGTSFFSLISEHSTVITTIVLLITGVMGVIWGGINTYSNFQRSVTLNKRNLTDAIIEDFTKSGATHEEVEKLRKSLRR